MNFTSCFPERPNPHFPALLHLLSYQLSTVAPAGASNAKRVVPVRGRAYYFIMDCIYFTVALSDHSYKRQVLSAAAFCQTSQKPAPRVSFWKRQVALPFLRWAFFNYDHQVSYRRKSFLSDFEINRQVPLLFLVFDKTDCEMRPRLT